MFYSSIIPLLITTALALPTNELLSRSMPNSFKLPLQRRAEGAVISNNHGPVWTSTILVGNQEIRMLIDTGSADLWVPSTELPDTQKGSHQLYNVSASQSASRVDGEAFDVNYSFKGASGYVVKEDVDIGGIVVGGMPVGVATNIGPYLVGQTAYDGILGLAFQYGSSIRPDQGMTFMEYAQRALDSPVFTVNLRPDSHEGTLEFGFIDKTLFSGNLNTAPIDNTTDGSWTVNEVTMTIGFVQITQPMIFDTGGANFMHVHPSMAAAYYAQVNGAVSQPDGSNWGVPCNEPLPDFSLQIGDGTAVIPGNLMNAGLLLGAAPLPLCTGALQGTAAEKGTRGSVGAPFFQAYYTVFNQAEPSIQYAPHY